MFKLFSQQDIRATERDKVKIYNSFRPGDIIRAEVVSILYIRLYVFKWSVDFNEGWNYRFL